MKNITAITKLVRLPNLLILGAALLLFYCFFFPLLSCSENSGFALLCAGMIATAASGYIINDIADVKIDRINKPGKNPVEDSISRKTAIIIYVLSLLFSIAAPVMLLFLLNINFIAIIAGSAASLFLYSFFLKKYAVAGNIVVAALSALPFFIIRDYARITGEVALPADKIFTAYGAVAFFISLVREIVKDMEDMPGDRHYKCRTLPIVAGIPFTKFFVLVIMVISPLTCYAVMGTPKGDLVLMVPPGVMAAGFLLSARPLLKASEKAHFHRLSNHYKYLMLAGLLCIIVLGIIINAYA